MLPPPKEQRPRISGKASLSCSDQGSRIAVRGTQRRWYGISDLRWWRSAQAALASANARIFGTRRTDQPGPFRIPVSPLRAVLLLKPELVEALRAVPSSTIKECSTYPRPGSAPDRCWSLAACARAGGRRLSQCCSAPLRRQVLSPGIAPAPIRLLHKTKRPFADDTGIRPESVCAVTRFKNLWPDRRAWLARTLRTQHARVIPTGTHRSYGPPLVYPGRSARVFLPVPF